MTDLLDRPTEERTDLLSERWEVETSVPVAITGQAPPGEPDFILMSHAEQFGGDFPIEMSDPERLLAVTVERLRAELGLTTFYGAIVIDRGELAYGGSTDAANPVTTRQALNGLLADFIHNGAGITRMAQVDLVRDILERFPVPVFGSPPSDLTPLAQLASASTCTVLTGVGAWTQSPILVVLGLGTALVIWVAKPSGNVLRRSLAERLARKLGTDYRPEDER